MAMALTIYIVVLRVGFLIFEFLVQMLSKLCASLFCMFCFALFLLVLSS
jgi:hypothetical protein